MFVNVYACFYSDRRTLFAIRAPLSSPLAPQELRPGALGEDPEAVALD